MWVVLRTTGILSSTSSRYDTLSYRSHHHQCRSIFSQNQTESIKRSKQLDSPTPAQRAGAAFRSSRLSDRGGARREPGERRPRPGRGDGVREPPRSAAGALPRAVHRRLATGAVEGRGVERGGATGERPSEARGVRSPQATVRGARRDDRAGRAQAGAQDGAPVRQAAPLRHHPRRHLGHRLAENGG